MPTVKLLKQAELEVEDACAWYEEKQKGLSLIFRKALRYTLGHIENNPNLYERKYNGGFHFAPLRKFPYTIVYWFDTNLKTVFVVSVFHTKRNPQRFDQ